MSDMLTLTVTDREIYRLGDFMRYEGGKYFIYDITTRYIGAECMHEYKLRRKEGLRTPPTEHQGMAGCSFEAKVTGVQKDTVQVDIAGDEWLAFDGKEILFTPDSVLITNNRGMMVEMNDQEGITMTSDKDILIQAENNMTIASGASSLLIAAEDIVQVKQGGTTMTLSEDIYFTGGEFRIQ